MSKNYYEQNRKLFEDNTKTDSKLTNILQKNFLKLIYDDFQYLADFPNVLISKETCNTNFMQLISSIHSIGHKIENEIDTNLLLLTEQKAKTYLLEFLDKAELIHKILIRRRNDMDPNKPENVNSNIGIFSDELKNREDIINAIQDLNYVQLRGIEEIIAIIKKKMSYHFMSNAIEKKDKNSNPRLTANQSVILLNRLGIFEHTHFKLMAKTEQANVLSQLTGYNKKNIKSYIENLGKKKSQLGPNYQADIDKIDDLLSSLE